MHRTYVRRSIAEVLHTLTHKSMLQKALFILAAVLLVLYVVFLTGTAANANLFLAGTFAAVLLVLCLAYLYTLTFKP